MGDFFGKKSKARQTAMMNQMNEFYDIYNKKHIELTGRPMPKEKSYWPSDKEGIKIDIMNIWN